MMFLISDSEIPGVFFSFILVFTHSLVTLPYMLVILLAKLFYWHKGDGKKELKREKTGMYQNGCFQK